MGDGQDGEDREEYYLSTIQRIVDEQKEELGPEVAIKWARRAPLDINADGEVKDFYGKGDDALETLRNFTEHQEFYLEVIQRVIDKFEELLGTKVALKYARKAPLQIMPDGEVQAYYGQGRKALETLGKQYEEVWGDEVAYRKIRHALEGEIQESEIKLLPERMQPKEKEGGLLSRLLG